MKITVSCQVCSKVLSVVEKDQVSDSDIAMYQASSSCDTVQGTINVDDGEGNISTMTVYDAQTNIQVTKSV